jgi:hypothetical protein
MTQSIGYNVSIELIHQHHDDNDHNYVFKTTRSFTEGQIHGCDL